MALRPRSRRYFYYLTDQRTFDNFWYLKANYDREDATVDIPSDGYGWLYNGFVVVKINFLILEDVARDLSGNGVSLEGVLFQDWEPDTQILPTMNSRIVVSTSLHPGIFLMIDHGISRCR